MNIMIGQCLEFCQCTHGGMGSNGEIGMIGIPFGFDIANSPFGGAWMLPSNNSSPCERPRNLANIVDLLDFLICPPMNFIGNETL